MKVSVFIAILYIETHCAPLMSEKIAWWAENYIKFIVQPYCVKGECIGAGRGAARRGGRRHSWLGLNRAINANCRAGAQGIVACVFRTAVLRVKGTCRRRVMSPTYICLFCCFRHQSVDEK